jgi:hypothetical protein
MFAKQVTAQELFKAICRKSDYGYNGEEEFRIDFIDKEETLQAFDALLSQARQEARREGRLEGLKEMDEAHEFGVMYAGQSNAPAYLLRQEYSGK